VIANLVHKHKYPFETTRVEEIPVKKLSLCIALALSATAASAQSLSSNPLNYEAGGVKFNLYGNVDTYLSYMSSSSGMSFTTLQEGAFLRTRLGVAGEKDVGDGFKVKFTLEQGVKGLSGEQAQADRLFDRQAWVGVAHSEYGELRVGRQNTLIFAPLALYQDFTYRSLGSLANSFSFPARLDDDIVYISPRIAGVKVEAHYSFESDDGQKDTSGTGTATDANDNIGIAQLGIDYENGPFRVGIAGLEADAPKNFVNQREVYFYNAYVNYNYGKGKIYLAHTESNNRAQSGLPPPTGFPLFPLGGQNDVANRNKDYGISTVSADYMVTEKLRVGALYSMINDQSGGNDEATGYAVGAYWNALRDTTLYLIVGGIDNETNGNYQFDGSAPLRKKFANADALGDRLTSVNVGFVYKF
jgi:predicted porin